MENMDITHVPKIIKTNRKVIKTLNIKVKYKNNGHKKYIIEK